MTAAAGRKPRRGVDRKGRSKRGGKFVRLGNGIISSPAWRSLSGSAIKYYVEIRRRYNGTNNGDLSLSQREAAALLGMSGHTLQRVQDELAEKGFIKMTRRGGFCQRLASTWRLTDEKATGVGATHDYRNWTP